MGLRGKGMLIVFNEVKARDEHDFNEWYNREHIDERVNLPGFRQARRYMGSDADPKYLATYECACVRDLATPGYLKLLANQSPWSKRSMARFTKFQRLTARIRVDLAHGSGGAVTCVRFVPERKQAKALTVWLQDVALPVAIRRPGMLGAFAVENDLAVANAPAKASGAVYPTAAAIEWAVVLEGADVGATAAAAKACLSRRALAKFGVTAVPRIGTYQFLFGNER